MFDSYPAGEVYLKGTKYRVSVHISFRFHDIQKEVYIYVYVTVKMRDRFIRNIDFD